jgi:DNA-binding transcriptional LysR family regulator
VQLDLNLLTALDALLEEGSVAGAAERLHLSAPAMSRALARIRRATGDDILVRSGRTMTPTPRALELRDETRELVARAVAVLSPPRRLDLAALTRVFTVRGHDALVGALAPALVEVVAATAPGVGLRFLAETSGESRDLLRGQVDLELGSTEPELPEIAAEVPGSDTVVVVLRAGHPLGEGELTAARFAAAEHVTASRRGRLRGVVDDRLAELGLRRRVLAALPTAAAVLDLVARSDAIAVLPGRLCRPGATGLLTRPVPVELPGVPIVVSWHRRYDSDPAHAWLRHAVVAALRPDGPGGAGWRP